MNKSQLMKGILKGCILKIIEQSETYGYEIVTQLQENGFTEVREGTLYPLLLRLEKKKLITATYEPSPLGPSRKYYALTPDGDQYLRSFLTSWKVLFGRKFSIHSKPYERYLGWSCRIAHPRYHVTDACFHHRSHEQALGKMRTAFSAMTQKTGGCSLPPVYISCL